MMENNSFIFVSIKEEPTFEDNSLSEENESKREEEISSGRGKDCGNGIVVEKRVELLNSNIKGEKTNGEEFEVDYIYDMEQSNYEEEDYKQENSGCFSVEKERKMESQAKFKCLICGYKTNRKSSYDSHSLIHTQDKKFKCSECVYESVRKENLKRHLLTHVMALEYASNDEYKSKETLKNHLLQFTTTKFYKCPECSYECLYKSNLSKHLLVHSNTKLFKCSQCNYGCNYKRSLRAHLLKHKNITIYKCSFCNYKCNHKYNFRRHIVKHSEVSQDHLPDNVNIANDYTMISTKTFTESKNSENELKDLKNFEKTENNHDKENAKTVSKSENFKVVMEDLQFTAEKNDTKLLTQALEPKTKIYEEPELRAFVYDVLDGEEEKERCKEIGKNDEKNTVQLLRILGEMKECEKSSKGKAEIVLNCSFCDYTSNSKRNFRRHQLIHSTEKRLNCTICNYRCNDKSNLNKHMVKHIDEKLFQCADCDYKCNARSKLRRHSLTHLKEKLFKCPECTYECNRKDHMKAHIKRHLYKANL